jgi:DNA-binding PadR family transcriptional regulator
LTSPIKKGIISIIDISNFDIFYPGVNLINYQDTSQELLPSALTPAMFHILFALVTGEKHGYAIRREVETNTQGQIKLGPGTLYGTIKSLLATGLIEECEERPDPKLDDQRRRYYRLTGPGKHMLMAEFERLAHLVDLARSRQLLRQTE